MSVGLVPTMGALHDGHLSLIQQARQENDRVVVSIFVNPLQFSPSEDLQRYPRDLERDREKCEQVGVDVIFAPSLEALYGTTLERTDLTQVLPPVEMMAELCGRSRPVHFPGVATVVVKLLNIVQPDRAYFGQKDAQQVAIIRRVVADLNLPVELRICPIVREPDGLAMSSRNQYLSEAERSQATILYRSLQQAEALVSQGKTDRESLLETVRATIATVPAVRLEYAELVHPDTMEPLEQVEEAALLAIAAHVGTTRLIDNLILRNRQPILAIDGPAGAGKTTVVRKVAQQLGLLYLDTGAMYRALTWLVLHLGIAPTDEVAIAELVSQCQLQISDDPTHFQIWVNGQEVTQEIRSPEVTAQVSVVSAHPTVRRDLVRRQQQFARRGGIVMDGRDIGTYVFPDAELKIFLTASVEERARRRQQDLKRQGYPEPSLEELERTIRERDQLDSTRRTAPLRKAADAIEIVTDGLTADEVSAKIVTLYQSRIQKENQA